MVYLRVQVRAWLCAGVSANIGGIGMNFTAHEGRTRCPGHLGRLSSEDVGREKRFDAAVYLGSIVLAFAITIVPTALAQSYPLIPLAYSTIYDEPSTLVTILTCGEQLKALGYTTLGSLPGYPYIGGSANVTDGDASSPNCGECALINFAGAFATVLLVDHADEGIVVSEEVMQWLAPNGNVTDYPYGTAELLEESDPSHCGLSS